MRDRSRIGPGNRPRYRRIPEGNLDQRLFALGAMLDRFAPQARSRGHREARLARPQLFSTFAIGSEER
jgi:hypothetical protein